MEKRETFLFVNFKADFGVNVSRLPSAHLRGYHKEWFIPPRIAARNTRGPLLFNCIRVDYNEETNRLNLPPGLIVGKDFNRDIGDEEDGNELDEYANTAMDTEHENSALAGMIFNNYPTRVRCLFNNYSTSARWIWEASSQRGA